ncbi:MAG: T9SS type A sorting domain-containing protein [Saprospiraceae bacterium]|nr:T9SS type A sorting domain-containing protein [Saprospiraceae bacterium]
MKIRSIYILFFGLLTFGIEAQPYPLPAVDSLTINNLSVHFNAGGALFWDFTEGQFNPNDDPSLIRASGLWFGGISQNEYPRVSAQMFNHQYQTDFKAGLIDPLTNEICEEDFNRIWKVNRQQVLDHMADFQDDGDIDFKIPAIYAWPGIGNPFFAEYNDGINIPDGLFGLADFYDFDGNNIYDPDMGDFPVVRVNGCSESIIPSQFAWFAFNDDVVHYQTMSDGLKWQVYATIFAFNCTDNQALNNAVFAKFKTINYNEVAYDSTFIGAFFAPSIGCPEDDYYGSSPDRALTFAYNSDNEDAPCAPYEGYESAPPAVGMDILRGPIKTIFDQNGNPIDFVEVGVSSSGHFNPVSDVYLPISYYNLLSGSLPDGSPIPNNGFPFPDFPTDIVGISELSLGTPAGERNILTASGPFQMVPGAINEYLIAYSFFDGGADYLDNVSGFVNQSDEIQAAFDNCFDLSTECTPALSKIARLDISNQIQLFPNPASKIVNLESGDIQIERVLLYDISGHLIQEWQISQNQPLSLELNDLPGGLYILHVSTEKGVANKKLIIE